MLGNDCYAIMRKKDKGTYLRPMKNFFFVTALIFLAGQSLGQFTFEDSLRGSVTPERAWWDLNSYHLDIEVNPDQKWIGGYNEIFFTALENGHVMQIDLQHPMKIISAQSNEQNIKVLKKAPHVYHLIFEKEIKTGEQGRVKIFYEGYPKKAVNAPWDGGFSWSTNKDGLPFIATSCQNLGSSVWWPCKDHMYDEPDSMVIAVTVPKPLMNVSNGRLVKEEDLGHKRKFTWQVINPINNYCVSLNIAAYETIRETYNGQKGKLDLTYFVLPENLKEAKEQFQQVKQMLDAFEYWFGPYPFYEDGYQLIQVPYLGMEHQSAVAYGNKFKNGYLGSDLSGTGWGLKWDYIIIHESGHEWFANNITYKDIADMWVHEGFTTYSEALFTEFHYGKEAGQSYVIGQRKNISNDSPIIGQYDVNNEGSGDMYYKGANLLNMIRQINNNDSLWRQMLIEMNQKYFYHQTITSNDVELFMSDYLKLDLKPIFDQYLRTKYIPRIEVKTMKGKHYFRWQNCIDGFHMPIDITINGKNYRLEVTTDWGLLKARYKKGKIKIDRNYYILTK